MKTILHLEDRDRDAELIDDYLLREGYQVLRASEPTEARKFVTQSLAGDQPQIDGVLADLRMKDPGGDKPYLEDVKVGIEFIRWLRQQAPYTDVPIGILTIAADDKRMPGWVDAYNITFVLPKPIMMRLVAESVLRYFGPP